MRAHEDIEDTKATRYESLDHELPDYDYATGDDDGPHRDDCDCEVCEPVLDRRSPEEIAEDERLNANVAPSLFPIDAEPSDEAQAKIIAEMLREQEAKLSGAPALGPATLCGACKLPLWPHEGKGKGRPALYHPGKCKEAAMKRQQRGATVRKKPEEKPPYVVPGYTGLARPSAEAARRMFDPPPE
ncbi:MAG: hypothetical protein WB438_03680 [Candidatus Cybelea sp.]